MSGFGNSCPDEWEARSEGRRAQERGFSHYGNPYVDECDEAASAWRSGYDRAQRAEDERRAEAEAQRRQQELFEEQEWERAQEELYYQQRDGYR